MARFLIEAQHEAKHSACVHAFMIFRSTGSHFLTNADWGCIDGEHKAWMIVDVETKAEAMAILPPAFRANAKITSLEKYSLETMDKFVVAHEG